MLERVQRAWDKLHQRPSAPLYRRVSNEDATAEDPFPDDDWHHPMMTTSMCCPGSDGSHLVANCRSRRAERRPSTDAVKSSVHDDGDWWSLTVGQGAGRCHCAKTGERIKETAELQRLKSPIAGRRLRAIVADDQAAATVVSASGSASCPGSPRDVSRLSAVVGRRLQLGLSPRLSTRRPRQQRTDCSTGELAAFQPRQVFQHILLHKMIIITWWR